MKASFVSFLKQKYPQLNIEQLELLISEQLLSPFQVSLTSEQINQIQTEISQYWQLRQWGATTLASQYEALNLPKPNNKSVCMSYDFHINSEGQPELIEINTNAAFLALGLELYQFLGLNTFNFTESHLIEMFQAEMDLVGLTHSSATNKSVAIIDEAPATQRLYLEFLVYQQMLQKNGFNCEIFDINETESIKDFSLIYNRYTDFYLKNPASATLKNLFIKNKNFSPNPYEYFLLADKQRLIDWNLQIEIPKPRSLLPVYDLAFADKEQIWAEKKSLFIKPKNSFGSKQAYKAGSMSRKMFDEVYNENFIAQKLSVPSEIEVTLNEKPEKLKYDLRCFAYGNQLQLIVARLYQGQTTNLKTIGGGFAAIKIR